jgi:glutathione S-transferase
MHTWYLMTNHFGSLHTPYAAAVTLLDLLFYLILAVNVSRARSKHKVEAPSTDGPAAFRRVYRAHMNMLEQLAIHWPLLWLNAFAVGDKFAALLGCLWLIGRILYARDYYRDAKLRSRGFFVALAANAILFLSAVAGVIASF